MDKGDVAWLVGSMTSRETDRQTKQRFSRPIKGDCGILISFWGENRSRIATGVETDKLGYS